MVDFLHGHVVVGEGIHHVSQAFVEGEKQVGSQAEVGSVEKGVSPLAGLFDFVHVLEPTSGTGNHWYAGCETVAEIVHGCIGSGKLNGDFGRSESGRIKVLSVVDVNDAD